MQHKHHHHVGALTIVPIALFLLAPQWGKASMAPTIEQYTESAERAEQHMHILNAQFEDLQRSVSLIKNGEDEVKFGSTVSQHWEKNYISPTERMRMAKIRNDVLKQRIAAFRSQLEEITKHRQTIYIDLSDQRATLIEDGAIVAKYPVSSGAADTPTPVGKHQIYRKQELRVSSQDTPYRMPYYMAFTKSHSHGLHALPYLGDIRDNSDFWHEAREHIGIPVSHGCVRFLPEDAEAVYEWVTVGTPVFIGT